MRKLLLIAEAFYNYNDAIKSYFQKNDFIVEVFDKITVNYSFKEKLRNKIDALNCNGLYKVEREVPSREKERISEEILKLYREYRPDVVLVLKGNWFSNQLLTAMNSSVNILWMMDSFSRFPFLIQRAKLYNKVFVFEYSDIDMLAREGVAAEYLPLCADSNIYYPQLKEKDIDVLFVGAIYANRKQLLDKLLKKFPNLNIRLYGYFLNRNEPIKRLLHKLNIIDKNYYKPISPQEVNNLYSRSKICLNIHHHQTVYGANMRVFEILAARAFELVDKNAYLTKTFEGGVAFFENENELFEKIEYYVNNQTEREQIAREGYEIVTKNHLFKNRLDIILNYING